MNTETTTPAVDEREIYTLQISNLCLRLNFQANDIDKAESFVRGLIEELSFEGIMYSNADCDGIIFMPVDDEPYVDNQVHLDDSEGDVYLLDEIGRQLLHKCK